MKITNTLLTAVSVLAVMATVVHTDETRASLVAFNDSLNADAAK